MKKYIIIIALATTQMMAVAQTINVHFKNGQKVQYNSSNVDYVDFSEKAPEPTVTAGTAIDLGLSVYWSSCNLGAEAPEEYGDFYAWGETKPKSTYLKETYSYYDNSTKQYIKIGNTNEGNKTNNICGTEYDAATVNLGSDWRMPTKQEMEELCLKCSWEWTQIKGVYGFKISSKNGSSIFLPTTGYILNQSTNHDGWTFYPTGEIVYSGDMYESPYRLIISGTSVNVSNVYQGGPIEYGFVVRPVTVNPNAGGNQVDHSKDYLVTEKISAAFLGGAISSINGKISSGSTFNVKFSNNSSESVILTKIQLNDAETGTEGNNLLSEEVEVPAGTEKSYSIRVGSAGIYKPVICFSYRYNRKTYKAQAEWKSNF